MLSLGIMKTFQTYYTLRRRSDGAWLASTYPYIKVVKQPTLIKRLDTARKHRIRGMLDDKHDHGTIDIEEVILTIDVQGTLAENEKVRERIAQMIDVMKKESDLGTKRRRGSWTAYSHTWVSMIAEKAESLMQTQKGAAMRYVAFLSKSDDTNNPTRMAIRDMAKVAKFRHDDGVYLIKDEASLIAMKLCEGFIPDLIYDLETKELILK